MFLVKLEMKNTRIEVHYKHISDKSELYLLVEFRGNESNNARMCWIIYVKNCAVQV